LGAGSSPIVNPHLSASQEAASNTTQKPLTMTLVLDSVAVAHPAAFAFVPGPHLSEHPVPLLVLANQNVIACLARQPLPPSICSGSFSNQIGVLKRARSRGLCRSLDRNVAPWKMDVRPAGTTNPALGYALVLSVRKSVVGRPCGKAEVVKARNAHRHGTWDGRQSDSLLSRSRGLTPVGWNQGPIRCPGSARWRRIRRRGLIVGGSGMVGGHLGHIRGRCRANRSCVKVFCGVARSYKCTSHGVVGGGGGGGGLLYKGNYRPKR
jgi:hypothetical protein